MQLSKFVVKCGNFAVLVDLHILPLSTQDNSSWFSQEHKKEVSALIRDAVEQRVRQFPEARQGPSKHRKEFSPDSPLCLKGQTLRLAAFFMKRHVNLRCINTQHFQELRVFPERCVVCVSFLECAMAHTAGLNMDVMEQSGQNKSEYFSVPRETLDLLNSSTITKRAALQKIAGGRQANAQPQPGPEQKLQALDLDLGQGTILNQPLSDAVEGALKEEVSSPSDGGIKVSMQGTHEGSEVSATVVLVSKVSDSCHHLSKDKQNWKTKECPEKHDGGKSSQYETQDCDTAKRRRRCIPSSSREDFDQQEPKRVRLMEPSNGAGTYSDSTIGTFLNSTTGPSPSHPAAVQVERVLEEELLTHGKQTLSLPLSNGTAKQTNQSRLATSLRGLSVKAVSSGSSISSRLAAKAEERVSAPRISRLRRLKKS